MSRALLLNWHLSMYKVHGWKSKGKKIYYTRLLAYSNYLLKKNKKKKNKDDNVNIYNDVYTYNITIMDYIKILFFFSFQIHVLFIKLYKQYML